MMKIEIIQHQHKPGIHLLLERINEVDNLGYSLTDEWLDYMIDSAGESIFIAASKGQLVGLATCMINEVDPSHGVINIVVHPDHRNRGIGTGLHNQVMNYAKHRNIKTLEAYIKQRLDNSVYFAEKRGFTPLMYAWEMRLEVKKAKEDLIAPGRRPLIFRQADVEDGHHYAHIINQTFGDPLGSDVLKDLLKDPSIRVYMLASEEEIIGTITIQFKPELSTGYLYDIGVLQDHRSKGYGTYMIKESIEELKAHHIKIASLTVTGENKKALSLYQRLGFVETDIDILGRVSF